MQFTFRCKCGVMVITTDPVRFKCRTCEPKEHPSDEKFRQTRMLRPPPKEKDDEPKT